MKVLFYYKDKKTSDKYQEKQLNFAKIPNIGEYVENLDENNETSHYLVENVVHISCPNDLDARIYAIKKKFDVNRKIGSF
jgi:hypothetical protein